MTPRAQKAGKPTERSLTIMAIMTAFLYADQNLLAPNLTMVATEFGLTMQERDVKLGGHIALAFFLVGGLVALIIGRFADRYQRTRLLALVVLLGEIPCAATYFCNSYEQLFVCRVLTGIAIGGAPPLVYSLMGDLVEPKRRPAAAGLLLTAMGCGILFGQILSGLSSPHTGWRLPFVLVAVPNIFIVLIFYFSVQEPAREELSPAVSTERSFKAYAKLFRIPSNRVLLLQSSIGTLPWAMIFVFLNDYLAQDRHFGLTDATLIIAALGSAAIFGALVGGVSGNNIYQKNPRYLPWACFLPTLIAPVPLWFLVSGHHSPSLSAAIILAITTGFTAAFAGPNLRAVLLNVNLAERRGSMTALLTLTDDLGKGLGPALIAGLVIIFGRAVAFEFTVFGWILCGLIAAKLIWTYPKDEKRISPPLDMMKQTDSSQANYPVNPSGYEPNCELHRARS